jgi:phage gp16-like protein
MQTRQKVDRNEARRKAELGKIHVAKKRLGLDDDTYRLIIARVCAGKTSAAGLDEAERGALLDEFKRLGFREGNSFTTKLSDFTDRQPQVRLIRGLWADCKALGVISDASEKALRKFVKRQTGKEALQWLTAIDGNKVVEGLKVMKSRAVRKEHPTGR